MTLDESLHLILDASLHLLLLFGSLCLLKWFVINPLVAWKIGRLTRAPDRSKSTPRFEYKELFDRMDGPSEVRAWVKKDIPDYFSEWPRGAGAFLSMLQGMRSCKYAKDLDKDVEALTALWYDPEKAWRGLKNYDQDIQ